MGALLHWWHELRRDIHNVPFEVEVQFDNLSTRAPRKGRCILVKLQDAWDLDAVPVPDPMAVRSAELAANATCHWGNGPSFTEDSPEQQLPPQGATATLFRMAMVSAQLGRSDKVSHVNRRRRSCPRIRVRAASVAMGSKVLCWARSFSSL